MIEITENNYKCIKCNGVIIGVPKSENLGYKFSIYFECALRSDGKHGYPKQGMWFTGDSENFYAIAYDMDYYLKNGFYFDSSNRTSWINCFDFDKVRYYQFKDFEEFCIWYLQHKYYKISQTGVEGEECIPKVVPENTKEEKTWIHEKCGTNTCPPGCPEHPPMNGYTNFNEGYEKKGGKESFTQTPRPDAPKGQGKKMIKRRDKYKDILKILELRDRIDSQFNYSGAQRCINDPRKLKEYTEELFDFLEEGVEE